MTRIMKIIGVGIDLGVESVEYITKDLEDEMDAFANPLMVSGICDYKDYIEILFFENVGFTHKFYNKASIRAWSFKYKEIE